MTSIKYIGMDVHTGKYFDCGEELCRQVGDGMRHRDQSEHHSAIHPRAVRRFARHI